MCYTMDVENGGCGVCYQGNGGDKPDGLIHQLHLLKDNIKLLLGDNQSGYIMI